MAHMHMQIIYIKDVELGLLNASPKPIKLLLAIHISIRGHVFIERKKKQQTKLKVRQTRLDPQGI